MEEKEIIKEHLEKIKKYSEDIKKDITIMEICGGHTRTIMEYGIRKILPKNINLISGPGCPVCVSSQYDIDCMIEIASSGVPIATYGDMLKVPGSKYSLSDIRAKNGKVFEVYSTEEVIELKKKYPDIVFFGIGFETTAPMTAFLLKNNIAVYSCHKLVPPALKILSDGELKIDGFIAPGHVSTIIGRNAYDQIKHPQVIAGFTPVRILRAISMLLELIRDKKNIALNGYKEFVSEKGNTKALKILDEEFFISDSHWRGLGIIPKSGLEVKNKDLNAKLIYKDIIKKVPAPKKSLCKCGEVLKGIIQPKDCPLYKKLCTPDNPQGACMVSSEGACAIAYEYEQ